MKKNKKYWECFWCKRDLEKIDFKRKSVLWQPIYVCQKCWYYNSI